MTETTKTPPELEELAEKTQKLAIRPENPESSASWHSIPVEMRAELVDYIDFKSRMCLRGVSQAEKSIIDSKSYHLSTVKLLYRDRRSDVLFLTAETPDLSKNTRIRMKSKINHHKTLRCTAQILKTCKIDTLEVSSELGPRRDLKIFWKELEDARSRGFRFKTFKSISNDPVLVYYFLKNSDFKTTREIVIGNRESKRFPIGDLLNLEVVINAKLFQFKTATSLGPVYQFAKDWIEKDVEIGKTLRISVQPAGDFGRFAEIFEERIFSTTSVTVRIHTDNPSKHLLFRLEHLKTFRRTGFYSLTVIPSNLLESEYEKNDQWIWDEEKEEFNDRNCDNNRYQFDYEDDEDICVPLDSDEEFYLSD